MSFSFVPRPLFRHFLFVVNRSLFIVRLFVSYSLFFVRCCFSFVVRRGSLSSLLSSQKHKPLLGAYNRHLQTVGQPTVLAHAADI